MITCVRKIRILLLKVEECPDFSILQSNYPYVTPMEELASTLKVWIFPNFCHFPWIFASRQRNVPGFSGIFAYIRIFSSINWNHPIYLSWNQTGKPWLSSYKMKTIKKGFYTTHSKVYAKN